MVVGDRPDDLEAALRFLADEGIDLVVTSGGLGPTADDLTAEVVGRFAGRELVLDEEMEEKIAEILRGFARRFGSTRRRCWTPTASRRWCRRGRGDRPGGHGAGARGAGRRAGDHRAAGPAARAAADVAAGARDRAGARGARPGDAAARLHDADVRGARVRDRQEPARDRAGRGRPRRAGDHHLPARGGDRDRHSLPRRGRGGAEAVRDGLVERHRRQPFSLDGETIDDQVAGLLRGRRLGLAESCSGGLLAARLTDLPGASAYFAGGVVAYSNEAKAELLGVDPALIEATARSRPRSPRRWRRGAGALRRRRRGRGHRHRRARRRHRGEAGRLRLLQRQARRRHRDRPRPGDPRRPR